MRTYSNNISYFILTPQMGSIYRTFLMGRTSGVHPGQLLPKGQGARIWEESHGWGLTSKNPRTPYLGKVREAVPGWHQGSSGARGEEAGPRSGWEQNSATIWPAEGNQVRHSTRVTRDIHGDKTGQESKWAPRSKVFRAREGHSCSWTGDYSSFNKAQLRQGQSLNKICRKGVWWMLLVMLIIKAWWDTGNKIAISSETTVIGLPQAHHLFDPRRQGHVPAPLCQIHLYQALMCRFLHPPPHTTAQKESLALLSSCGKNIYCVAQPLKQA